MRFLILLTVLLVAGCTSPAETQSTEPEPLANKLPMPDNVAFAETGDLLEGVDKTWSWELDPRVRSLTVEVMVSQQLSAEPATSMIANLYHNGTHVAGTGTSSANISIGVGNTGSVLINYDVRGNATSKTLPQLAGDWVVSLEGTPQPGAYDVVVSGKYDA